jgi:hypothetical protein
MPVQGRPKRGPRGVRGLVLGVLALAAGVGCFFDLDVPTVPPNPPPPSLTVLAPKPGDTLFLNSEVSVVANSVNGVASVSVLCGQLDAGPRQAFIWGAPPYQGLVDFSACQGLTMPNPDGGADSGVPYLQLGIQAISDAGAVTLLPILVQFDTTGPNIAVAFPPTAQPNSPFTVTVTVLAGGPLSSFPIVLLAGAAADSITAGTDGGQQYYSAFFAHTPGLGTDNYDGGQPIPIEVLTDTDEVVRLTVEATVPNGNTATSDQSVDVTRVVWDRFIPGVPAQDNPIDWAAEPVAYSGGLVLPLSTTAGGGAESVWIPGAFSKDDGTFSGFDSSVIGALDGGYSAVAINGEGQTLFYELVARTGNLLLAPPPPATTPVVKRSVLGLVQVEPPLTHISNADGGALICLQDSVTACSDATIETLSCLTDQLATVSATSGEPLIFTGPPDAGFVAGAAGRYISPNPAMCGGSWNFVDLTTGSVTLGPRTDPNGAARDCAVFAVTKLLAVGDGTFVVQLASGCDETGLNEFPILRVGTGSTILGAYTAPLGTARNVEREVVGVLSDGRVVTLINNPPNTDFELWSMNPTATDIPDVVSPIAGLYDSADNLEGSLVARSTYSAQDGSFALLVSGAPLGVGVLAFGPGLRPLWFYLYPRITSTGNSRLVSASAFGDVYLLDEFNSRAVSLRVEPAGGLTTPGAGPDAGCVLCLTISPSPVTIEEDSFVDVTFTTNAPADVVGTAFLTVFSASEDVVIHTPPNPPYAQVLGPGGGNTTTLEFESGEGAFVGEVQQFTATIVLADGGYSNSVSFGVTVTAP